jgi:hypothetical protein
MVSIDDSFLRCKWDKRREKIHKILCTQSHVDLSPIPVFWVLAVARDVNIFLNVKWEQARTLRAMDR